MEINKIPVNQYDSNQKPPRIQESKISDQAKTGFDSTNVDESKLSKVNLSDVVDTLNSAAKSINERISFSFNEKINRVIMTVTDMHSHEVVREIPTKEMVRLLEHIHELIGMFVNESR